MSAQPTPKPQIFWRIVYEKLGGKLYIHHLGLQISDSGVDVFKNLKQDYNCLKRTSPFRFWDRGLGVFRPVVETATLSANSPPDLEAQRATRQVFVVARKREIELTAAFHDPDLLSSAESFVRDNKRFEIGLIGGGLEKEVLLIRLSLNWMGLLFLILLNLLVCIGAGIIMGVATKDVNLGVAVTSGMAAVVACVQAGLFLVYK